jgi:hypothetical protein
MQWAGFNFSMNLSFLMCPPTIRTVSAQCTYLLKFNIDLSGRVVCHIAIVWQKRSGKWQNIDLSDDCVSAKHPNLHHVITDLLLSKEESSYVISCLPRSPMHILASIFRCIWSKIGFHHHISLAWVVLPPTRQRKQTTFFSTRLLS